MTTIHNPNSHVFSRSDVNLAVNILEQAILKRFGEIHKPLSDAEWKGKSWEARSVIAFDPGCWNLVEQVKHTGAMRAFGKIEKREAGTVLRFIVFYEEAKNDKR